MLKIFKNKHFITVFALALVLVMGLGALSFFFADYSKIDLKEKVVTQVAQLQKTGVKEEEKVVRQPNLKDFAALLNSIETAAGGTQDPSEQICTEETEAKKEQEQKALAEEKEEAKKQEAALPKIAETPFKKQVIHIEKQNEQNITSVAPLKGKPRIAIVIDDMGMSYARLKQLSAIKTPLNFAFLPYADNLKEETQFALNNGHQIIVHVPMMPKSNHESLGPVVLKKEMSEEELKSALDQDLSAFKGYVGINNHMGSDFTENEAGMRIILTELKKRGLFFLDSKTTNDSIGAKIAREVKLPVLERDVFLDHQATEEFVTKQLALTEKVARRSGHAIAIGHPTKATIAVLEKWLPTLEAKGFELVTLSSLLPEKELTSLDTNTKTAQ